MIRPGRPVTHWYKKVMVILNIVCNIIIHVLWNHSSSWDTMFVGKQIFVCSWRRYYVGNLCDVTRKDNSYLIYLQTTERVFFLIFYDATKLGYLSCKHFDASSNCREVKPAKGLSTRWTKNSDRNLKK